MTDSPPPQRGRGTRPRARPIRVWVTDQERAGIEGNAAAAGLSASAFLRNLGLGYSPPSVFDNDTVLHIARLNGDQGRLGGLLKMWLSTRRGEGAPVTDVQKLLGDIARLQAALQAKVDLLEARR